jgi:hypothetical protein
MTPVSYNIFKLINRIFNGLLQRKTPTINPLENNDVSF